MSAASFLLAMWDRKSDTAYLMAYPQRARPLHISITVHFFFSFPMSDAPHNNEKSSRGHAEEPKDMR